MADAGSEQWEKNGRKDPTYIPDSIYGMRSPHLMPIHASRVRLPRFLRQSHQGALTCGKNAICTRTLQLLSVSNLTYVSVSE